MPSLSTPRKALGAKLIKTVTRFPITSSAEKMPKANKLLVLKVDTGLDVRTIVSGIAESFSPEEIIGKRVTVLINLAPRALRGVESEGMILMTNNAEGKLVFVNPDADGVDNGALIS